MTTSGAATRSVKWNAGTRLYKLLPLLALLPCVAHPAVAQNTPRKLVVVDAGHGGVDPGAHGPSGMREKHITLAVSRELARILRQDSTLEVRMTRDSDTLIALRDRTRMANRWRGGERPALFVSIHCNANHNPAGYGFETYFLSEAKTEDARRVAAMENAAEKYEEKPAQGGSPLSFILNDLKQNLYLRESSSWAEQIQHRLAQVHPGRNRGVKQAGFYVLNGAFMPAVLVELGFITNAPEERVLADATMQRRMAEQLALSIFDYFRTPAPTTIARGR
ncbi:MAG: N-acetylmuramoyl-L-alanine amidase [Gemmatimonadota bacterium]|nr:N-acetylmuramoyl-L-alanine amidase [Gemmatimonadota bacterium]